MQSIVYRRVQRRFASGFRRRCPRRSSWLSWFPAVFCAFRGSAFPQAWTALDGLGSGGYFRGSVRMIKRKRSCLNFH